MILEFPSPATPLPRHPGPAAVVSAHGSPWTIEARDAGMVLALDGDQTLGPRRLARLVRDVLEIREQGFSVAVACRSGAALESLRKVLVHRFVDILPSKPAAWRYVTATASATALGAEVA